MGVLAAATRGRRLRLRSGSTRGVPFRFHDEEIGRTAEVVQRPFDGPAVAGEIAGGPVTERDR
jgi:hypothetical protein